MPLHYLLLPLLLVLGTAGCSPSEPQTSQAAGAAEVEVAPSGLVEDILTEEEQAALTPTEVIELFTAGNERFRNNDLTARDHSEQVRKSAKGQFPKAIVLSCVDSRVPVEDVFDRGIGDIFVARVAGNVINDDMLGSMEYACEVAGSKLVVVLGHEYCGAVKSAVDGVELGNITHLLAKITPAVEATRYEGDRTAVNQEFLHEVCLTNINQSVTQIRTESSILAELEEKGTIRIVGALYDMDSGEVQFLD